MRRVALLGIDGGTFSVLDPLMSEGRLPNLSRIMAQGARAKLRSTIHPITPAAWSSMLTGLNPGKHGVFDFHRRHLRSYEMDLVNARARKGYTVWQAASQAGMRVGVLNVPVSYPPDDVNGFMVSGMDAPALEAQFTRPLELAGELLAAVPDYRIDADGVHETEEDYAEDVMRLLDARIRALDYLLERHSDLDLLISVFVEPDRLQHAFWKYWDLSEPDSALPQAAKFRDTIARCYERLDAVAGRMAEWMGDDGVLIVASDHGFGPLHKDVYLNKWLMDEGLLAFKGANLVMGLSSLTSLDWDRTRAYSYGFFGNINLNLVGREPNGLVQPGREAEELKRRLLDGLRGLRDPDTGEPLVTAAYRREDLYSGLNADRAPDILVVLGDYACMTRGDYEAVRDRLVGPPMRFHQSRVSHSGNHRLDGILMLHGSGVKPGNGLGTVSIMDVGPTILRLLRLAEPPGVDGRVLEEAFESGALSGTPRVWYVPASVAAASRGTLEGRDLADLLKEKEVELARVAGRMEKAEGQLAELHGYVAKVLKQSEELEAWACQLEKVALEKEQQLKRLRESLPGRAYRMVTSLFRKHG